MTYISYSGYNTHATCPLQYWHSYINKTRPPVPDNAVNALYGTTVGVLFEGFYRDSLWKHSDCVERMQSRVDDTLGEAIREAVRKGRVVDWGDDKANYRNRETLVSDIREAIPEGLQTIRSNRLVGPFMEAEMKLDSKFGRHVIGGRADFVVKRVSPHGDLIILDGKGSKHRDKYLDGAPRKKNQPLEGKQLKWYGMLYREKHKVVPDALGYVFWRFSGEKAMEWVDFTESQLDMLKHEILTLLDRITKSTLVIEKAKNPQSRDELCQELFPAQAGFHCRLCVYSEICEDGKKVVQRMKREAFSGVEELTLGVDS